tara:strand:- start:1962 stop:2333 length:372 start_codon:yes stop_codon:yes gene_type:complete
MAHPSKNLPKNLYYVSTADELVAPEGRHFFSVTSLDGGTVTLKGGGIFVQKDAVGDGDDNPNTGFINPTTGEAFVAADNPFAAGHYEALPATSVEVNLAAGQTVFGRFTSVTGTANKEFLVYA